MIWVTRILKAVLPIVVVFLAVQVFLSLKASRPKAQKKARVEQPPLVEVVEASVSREAVTITAWGTVKPSRVLTISPEVSGRITELHPQLVAGGRVSAGELLFAIEDQDYSLAVSQAQAQVTRARLEEQVETGRATVAANEWDTLAGELGGTAAGEALALREPHLAAARASVRSAQSQVALAELRLERTRVSAPWNARVQSEAVELGQLVGPQSRVATLVGTDTTWVEVSVPADRLPWIRIPGHSAEQGAAVSVSFEVGEGQRAERSGRVLRLLGDLDPKGKMARLLVEVVDPFELQRPLAERGIPLLGGAWVRADIEGRALDQAVAVPRLAIRDGDRVWVVDAEGKLQVHPVEIGWRERDRVLLTRGVDAGDRVVTSPLATPIPGMALRVAGEATAEAPSDVDPSAPEEGTP